MKKILVTCSLVGMLAGCQSTSVDRRGNWQHVARLPAHAQQVFQLVDQYEEESLTRGLRAKPPDKLDIKYAYELWQHPSGYAWVRRDEIIPVRTISSWYLIDPQGNLKAQMRSGQDPEWKDPQPPAQRDAQNRAP